MNVKIYNSDYITITKIVLMQAGTLHGVGTGNREFFGPFEMAQADRRMPFGAQESRDFQRQPHPPLPQVMDLPASEQLCTGPYKSQVHRWFYEHENPLKKKDCGAQMGRGEDEESEGKKRGGRVGGGN